AANLERVAIVPLDAPFEAFTVFEDNHHRGLRLDLLLEVEKLGMTVLRVHFGGVRGEMERDRWSETPSAVRRNAWSFRCAFGRRYRRDIHDSRPSLGIVMASQKPFHQRAGKNETA